MNSLKELYLSTKGLKNLGIDIDEKTKQQIEQKEEELIKTEILPTLSKDLEPILSEIERELVLVVEYKPNMPISVSLSRKTNIAELIQAKKLEIDPEVTHKELSTPRKEISKKAPAKGLCVYTNNEIIQEKTAAATFVKAIIKADVMQVRSLNLKFSGINIVSTRIDNKYGHAQKEVAPGIYVLTHSNTKMKEDYLKKISKLLKLGWKIKIIKK